MLFAMKKNTASAIAVLLSCGIFSSCEKQSDNIVPAAPLAISQAAAYDPSTTTLAFIGTQVGDEYLFQSSQTGGRGPIDMRCTGIKNTGVGYFSTWVSCVYGNPAAGAVSVVNASALPHDAAGNLIPLPYSYRVLTLVPQAQPDGTITTFEVAFSTTWDANAVVRTQVKINAKKTL